MDDRNATDDPSTGDAEPSEDPTDLPDDVIDEAERLTKHERDAIEEAERAAYANRRETLLSEYDFTARVRDEEDATLVLHPEEWVDDGVIRTDRIEDTSRAIEVPLEGTGDPDDWDTVDERNRELVREVRDAHGDVHAANAALLADFFGNHYAKPIESATATEIEEFRSDYFVRNAWPSKKQQDAIDDSIRLVYETAGTPVPGVGVQSR